MAKIQIPYNFTPRPYQLNFLRAMDGGYKRALLCWHRRAGKDLTVLNYTIKSMMTRVGSYYHCFPEYGQGRKALWDAADKAGNRHLDHFPPELVKSKNNTEMKIELVNGSIWQIVGADNYDKVVGAGPVGLVLSEYAVSDRYEKAWDYFSPMLVENGGWAVFAYTPRGRNHGWDKYSMALANPDWYCSLLTVDDTQAFPLSDIDKERREGKSEDMLRQEYWCDFVASTAGILIPFELIQAYQNRNVSFPSQAPRVAGLDPARFGDDKTGFVIRQANKIMHIEQLTKMDAVYVSGRIREAYRMKMFDVVCVDVNGLGGPIADFLRAYQIPTVDVNVSEASTDDMNYRMRDELWWRLRGWFDEKACGVDDRVNGALANLLVKDIQDIHYDFTPSGKRKIEGKDEMKARSGKSPDLGDALCLTFADWQSAYQDPRVIKAIEERYPEPEYNPLRHGLEAR